MLCVRRHGQQRRIDRQAASCELEDVVAACGQRALADTVNTDILTGFTGQHACQPVVPDQSGDSVCQFGIRCSVSLLPGIRGHGQQCGIDGEFVPGKLDGVVLSCGQRSLADCVCAGILAFFTGQRTGHRVASEQSLNNIGQFGIRCSIGLADCIRHHGDHGRCYVEFHRGGITAQGADTDDLAGDRADIDIVGFRVIHDVVDAFDQYAVWDIRRDFTARIDFVRQFHILQAWDMPYSECEFRLVARQQVVAVGQADAVEEDHGRNAVAQFVGHQVRIVLLVVGKAEGIAFQGAVQLQDAGDGIDQAVLCSDLHNVVQRQVVRIPAEADRGDSNRHVVFLDLLAFVVVDHDGQAVISGVRKGRHLLQPLSVQVIVPHDSIRTLQVACDSCGSVGIPVVGSAVGGNVDFPHIQRQNRDGRHPLHADLPDRLLHDVEFGTRLFVFTLAFPDVQFLRCGAQLVHLDGHRLVDDVIVNIVVSDVGECQRLPGDFVAVRIIGNPVYLAVDDHALEFSSGIAHAEVQAFRAVRCVNRNAVRFAVPVARVSVDLHICRFNQADADLAFLRIVVRLGYGVFDFIFTGFRKRSDG